MNKPYKYQLLSYYNLDISKNNNREIYILF